MTLPVGVMLPSELERRQIYYALKRWSSYTAWNRIRGYYQSWADTIEKSLREASEQGWEDKTRLPESDYVLILKGLANCDDGVTRLGKGDKRVFRSDVNGAFAMTRHGAFAHWQQAYLYIESGDIVGGNEFTPHWDEFMVTLLQLCAVWTECFATIIEPADLRGPTGEANLPYGVWLQEKIPEMSFPDPLPEIPDSAEEILVRTGIEVPHSGIWEPVEVPQRNIISLFKSSLPKGPFKPFHYTQLKPTSPSR